MSILQLADFLFSVDVQNLSFESLSFWMIQSMDLLESADESSSGLVVLMISCLLTLMNLPNFFFGPWEE